MEMVSISFFFFSIFSAKKKLSSVTYDKEVKNSTKYFLMVPSSFLSISL